MGVIHLFDVLQINLMTLQKFYPQHKICLNEIFFFCSGKYQVAQEKTQHELDKAHQEIDRLQEKIERNSNESRRVGFIIKNI